MLCFLSEHEHQCSVFRTHVGKEARHDGPSLQSSIEKELTGRSWHLLVSQPDP